MRQDGSRRIAVIPRQATIESVAERPRTSGRFDVGDIQFLPYEECSFDVVTAFHSLPFAADPLAALVEARRVAKPGAQVFIVIFGREEHNELAAVLRAINSLLPAAPRGAPGPLALSGPGTLDELAVRARLATTQNGRVETTYEYPDHETALRAIGSAGPTLLAERDVGKDAVTDAITTALAPYRRSTGGFQARGRVQIPNRDRVEPIRASAPREHYAETIPFLERAAVRIGASVVGARSPNKAPQVQRTRRKHRCITGRSRPLPDECATVSPCSRS